MDSGVLLTGSAGWAFVVFAVVALAMAVAVVVARNPVHSALFLLASFLLVACLFILEQAEFVGAVQIRKKRTVGIGVISGEECIEYGLTGPILRGSGVEWDLRRAQPYECYEELDFAIPVRYNGDTYDRYIVRVQEMRQSARILQQCLERLEPGEVRGKVPRVIKPAAEEVYASVESPKGELGFYCVSNGTNRPYRMHVRPPSFINLQALPRLAKGHLISDLVALIGTIDIVLGEVDR